MPIPRRSNGLANAKLADPDALGFDGPDEIVVSGGVVSAAAEIVQVCVAGEATTLPAASVARTSNVCDPAPRPLYAFGDPLAFAAGTARCDPL